MIVGSTVSKDGAIIQRWPVSVKVAIGLAPSGTKNYPEKLDKMVFLERGHQKAEWAVSPRLMAKFAKDCKHQDVADSCANCCREIKILLLSDDIDDIFPHELAWWKKSGKFCHGDGATAERRTDTGVFQVWSGPCKNNGCNDWEKGNCKGSGDLRFMLPDADFSIARIHTTSLRSIENIHSGLMLAKTWAGRLAGVCVPLRVAMEPSVYEEDGKRKTSIVPILSIGVNPRQLVEDIKSTSALFDSARKAFGKSMVVVEDDDERAPEIAREFPAPAALPAPQPAQDAPAESKPAEPVKQEQAPPPEEKKPEETKPSGRVVVRGIVTELEAKSNKGKGFHQLNLKCPVPGEKAKISKIVIHSEKSPKEVLVAAESARKQAEREVQVTCDIYDNPTPGKPALLVAVDFAFAAQAPELEKVDASGELDFSWMK